MKIPPARPRGVGSPREDGQLATEALMQIRRYRLWCAVCGDPTRREEAAGGELPLLVRLSAAQPCLWMQWGSLRSGLRSVSVSWSLRTAYTRDGLPRRNVIPCGPGGGEPEIRCLRGGRLLSLSPACTQGHLFPVSLCDGPSVSFLVRTPVRWHQGAPQRPNVPSSALSCFSPNAGPFLGAGDSGLNT